MTGKRLKTKLLIAAASSLVAACIIGLSVFAIIQVNTRFPQAVILSTKLGDDMELDGLKIKATSFEAVRFESLKSDESLYNVVLGYTSAEVDVLKACLTIKNESDKEAELPLYDVTFQSNDWANAVNFGLFKFYNGDRSLTVKLQAGESTDVVLPVLLHKQQFSSNAWSKIDNRNFQLVFSLYPQKKIIELF